jgi:hypothetical protein
VSIWERYSYSERQQSPNSEISRLVFYGVENLNSVVACSISYLPRLYNSVRFGSFNRTAGPKDTDMGGSSGLFVTVKYVGIIEGVVAFKGSS